MTTAQNQPSSNFVQKMGGNRAVEIENEYDDEDDKDEEDDGWGDDWGAPPKKKPLNLEGFDYQNTNLNKLSDFEIAQHKKKMDENFLKNQLKPGDAGF